MGVRVVPRSMVLADTEWHEVGLVPSYRGRIRAWSVAPTGGTGRVAVCDGGSFSDAARHMTYGRVSMNTDLSQLWVKTDVAGTTVSVELTVAV